MSRPSQLTLNLIGTTYDQTLGFGYNPASQIVSTTRSNDLYAWNGHGNGTTSSSADGRNRLDGHGGAVPTYDARGNITSDGTYSYTYSSENLLTSGANSGPLGYDPLMRFYQSGPSYFIHDWDGQLIADYYNGNVVGRYVPGAADDEPVALIDKFGARTSFHADEARIGHRLEQRGGRQFAGRRLRRIWQARQRRLLALRLYRPGPPAGRHLRLQEPQL